MRQIKEVLGLRCEVQLSLEQVAQGVGVSRLTVQECLRRARKADLRCYRLPRLIDELAKASALHKRSALLAQLAKVQLLVIDDFGLTPMSDSIVRDLLEVLEDRYDRQSTLNTSQLPIEQWHAYLGDKTVADAILDRLVHNAHKVALKGESMRKQKGLEQDKKPKPTAQNN